ncbi:MAG: hypothetical protein RIR00_1917 [Pseudomonadota bacterium]|jgi:glycosyltransferase involved in cell wall biosynthesis
MRIVHTEASCGWGGQEIRILEESRGMQARGHQVLLLCPPESRIFVEAPKRGVPVQALPLGKKRLRGAMALRRWLQANPVDVINTHSSTDTWLAALACKTLSRSPAIVRTRHISAAVANNAGTRWLYTRAVRHVVTTGEAIRRQLIEDNGFPGAMITSVPTGIDPARFAAGDKAAVRRRLGLAETGHYLGIVATLRSWKGHLYLLDAFARLDAPDWQLLIVGEGPMREPITDKIRELQLQQRVTMVGQQDCPEDWMRALDLFCLPSYANEGVPQAVLQAMLTALPIVTTPVGAITEAVQDGESAVVVPPKDAAALAAGLQRLMADPEARRRLGSNARQRAESHFSLSSMLDRMESVFSQAVHAQP